MKILSIVIPCYNSQGYMSKCIDSLLEGGEKVEIIIVNDGSSDATGMIADAYAQKFPSIIKTIHQKNGGHGAAINTGLAHATGIYFKVVDSDDWVNPEALREILCVLNGFIDHSNPIDMLVTNFIYDKHGNSKKSSMHYKGIIPEDTVVSWNDVAKFPKGRYLLMHSVIFRFEILKICKLELPNHTFYVDNLFVYLPLPYVKSMYYLNTNFYHYFIGREDQSVNEKNMIKRIDQQIKVNKLMLNEINLKQVEERKKRKYMLNYIEIVTIVSSIILLNSGTKENINKKKELWEYIKQHDRRLYFKLRSGILGSLVNLPGELGRKISLAAYRLMQEKIGFN